MSLDSALDALCAVRFDAPCMPDYVRVRHANLKEHGENVGFRARCG